MGSAIRSAGVLLALAIAAGGASAQQAQDVPEDPRLPVEMPALQQALIREEMIEHTSTLHQLLVLLAAGKLDQAAEIAEQQLGLSSMGKYAARTRGMGPGRFMPDAMRNIGIGMHQAASDFADIARQGDRDAAYEALQPVTAACVGCHASYRLE